MIDFNKLLKQEYPEKYHCKENKRDMCHKEVMEGCETCKDFIENGT